MAFYFVSDVHAGLEADGEARIVAWLDGVAADAEGIYLLGDIFDFWFEYPNAAPTRFTALLARFRELTARGIPIHFFPGNHDMWTLDYLNRACGLTLHPGGEFVTLYGRRLYVEHGDRQSVGSLAERLMQKLFRSGAARRLARALVPRAAMERFGNGWSRKNRAKHTGPHTFRGEAEGVVRFARRVMRGQAVDIFVFGHLHTPTAYRLSEHTTLYVLGGWIDTPRPVCGRLDAEGFSLIG